MAIIHHNIWDWGTQDIIILGGGLAFCMVSIEDDANSIAWIGTISVHESARHFGWGNDLLMCAEMNAVERGAKFLYLRAYKNDWPIEWYKRHGFMYSCDSEDGMAVLMKKL